MKRKHDKQSQSLTSHNSITTSPNLLCSFLLKVRMTFAEHAAAKGTLKEAVIPSAKCTVQLGNLWQILKDVFILIQLLQAQTKHTTLLEHK